MRPLLFAFTVVLGACGAPPPPPKLPPPHVGVVKVLSAPVSSEIAFLGQTEAVQQVELRARVGGTIDQKFFVDGDRVQKGQKLFQIDPRSPRAALAQSKANLASARASAQKARADAARARELYAVDAISQAQLDAAIAAESAGRAELNAMAANVESAALDTQYTTIVAPFAGRMGRTTVNVGNLVGPSEDRPLATLTRLDPIYVSFNMNEREYLSLRDSKDDTRYRIPELVAVELADGSVYEWAGRVVFISPEMDRGTGTFLLRALFPNPDEVLKPGLFAKLIMRFASKEPAILIPQESVVIRQSGSYVFVVKDDNTIEERKVTPGPTRGPLRIIRDGLDANLTVVAVGVHKVREGIRVEPTELEPLTLRSDPLLAAPPKQKEGDWMAEFSPRLPAIQAQDDATKEGKQ